MNATVAVLRTEVATYEVKRISAAPVKYVAYITGPVSYEPLHRDGRSFPDALRAIADYAEQTEQTLRSIQDFMREGLSRSILGRPS